MWQKRPWGRGRRLKPDLGSATYRLCDHGHSSQPLSACFHFCKMRVVMAEMQGELVRMTVFRTVPDTQSTGKGQKLIHQNFQPPGIKT